MFEGFEEFTISTSDDPNVSIFGLKSASSQDLPPLLLLHGFPQSRHIWHRVAPQLTSKFTVVVPDLRGYGESSKPEGIPAYAKSAMARDFATLMEKLGFSSFFVCGHDRGGRVAHKLCVDYPERVRKVMFLDICPTLAMYDKTTFDFAKAYYHWFFLIQPSPLPETFIGSNSRAFAEAHMGVRQETGLSIFDPQALDYYAKKLGEDKALHAMCNDYRAAATLDMEESRDDLANGKLIKCPVMAIWGKFGVIEKLFAAVKEWKAVTANGVNVEGFNVESGHYIPEEAPDDLVNAILRFFV